MGQEAYEAALAVERTARMEAYKAKLGWEKAKLALEACRAELGACPGRKDGAEMPPMVEVRPGITVPAGQWDGQMKNQSCAFQFARHGH